MYNLVNGIEWLEVVCILLIRLSFINKQELTQKGSWDLAAQAEWLPC